MNVKKLVIIALIVIAIILIAQNWSKIKKSLGFGQPDPDGADIYTAELNEMQSVINELTGELANANTAIGGGDSSAVDTANKINKQIQILKLQQKVGVKFSVELIDDLMKESLADLIQFNTMTNEDLLALFQMNY